MATPIKSKRNGLSRRDCIPEIRSSFSFELLSDMVSFPLTFVFVITPDLIVEDKEEN